MQAMEISSRSDGARYRRVTLAIERNGSLTLLAREIGADAEAVWGLDEEEVTLSIAPDQLGPLALALAAEVLKGGRDAVRRLADICEAHEVPCRIACWS